MVYKKKPEEITSTYYLKNRDRCLAYVKQYNTEQRELKQEYNKLYYKKNKIKMDERTRKTQEKRKKLSIVKKKQEPKKETKPIVVIKEKISWVEPVDDLQMDFMNANGIIKQ